MRQLDSCDFCADTPDGVFEVVPASVADGPVRLALCGDCRATLQSVVDPLLDSDGDAQPATADAQPAAEPEPEPAGQSDASGGDSGDSADGSDDGVTIEEQGGGTPAERPDGYAQVLRLLQNRAEGIPREDLHALATNAYDLTSSEYEAALDAALENGDVEETPQGLRTT